MFVSSFVRDSPSGGGQRMTRSSTVDERSSQDRPAPIGRSPTVIQADGTSYSYGIASQPRQTAPVSNWFSGLRQKISQLSGMSEWLSQLGLGSAAPASPAVSANSTLAPIPQSVKHSSSGVMTQSSVQNPASSSGQVKRSHSLEPEVFEGFSYDSIRLDDCAIGGDEPETAWDVGSAFWMDLDSSHDWNDTLERQHFGPLDNLVTIGGSHKGQGHNFVQVSLMHPTWCDKCGDFIWGFLRQAVKCDHCNYTCHERCQSLVTLDCRSGSSTGSSIQFPSLYPSLPRDGTLPSLPSIPDMKVSATDSDKENGSIGRHMKTNPLFDVKAVAAVPSMSPVQTLEKPQSEQRIAEVYVRDSMPFEWGVELRGEALKKLIDEYNANSDDGLSFAIGDDGETFTGFIQVHMNFTRPINIVAGEKPPTVYDVVNTAKSTMSSLRTITSFFLPRNTVKTLNINSNMSTRQMIVTLLRKFKVADNPRKFALYECVQEENDEMNTLLRKMIRVGDDVCPLKLALSWGKSRSQRCLVLQENDTGDILWEAFEVPELENFLRILGMEEHQYKLQVHRKYQQYRFHIDQELRSRGVDVDRDPSAPPLEFAPPPPPMDFDDDDEFGTFHTLRSPPDVFQNPNSSAFENPIYVNLNFLNQGAMGESTKL